MPKYNKPDTGIITFLNCVTATTSAEYNIFMYSQWHILIKAVTGDVTGAGDIYLDASVDNTDWDTAILSQNIAPGAAATYYYTWAIDGCYNYIRIRFVRTATTITITTTGKQKMLTHSFGEDRLKNEIRTEKLIVELQERVEKLEDFTLGCGNTSSKKSRRQSAGLLRKRPFTREENG